MERENPIDHLMDEVEIDVEATYVPGRRASKFSPPEPDEIDIVVTRHKENSFILTEKEKDKALDYLTEELFNDDDYEFDYYD